MFFIKEMKVFSFLPLIAIAVPVVGAIVVAVMGKYNEKIRNAFAFFISIITLLVMLTILVKTLGDNTLYFESGLIRVSNEQNLKFIVDKMGAFFAFITSLIWVAAIAHAISYMNHEEKRTRFFTMMMLIEASTLGVFLTGDFFSLFVFFEIMGLLGYFFVVHSETEAAFHAAKKYMYMTIIGGLSLLMGILLYSDTAGTLSFIPIAESEFITSSFNIFALFFLIVGFGVKAGMMPLHIWLPDAHPAAPSPASALLSGVMIKAGAYGILRVSTSFFYTQSNQHAAYELTQLIIREPNQAIKLVINAVNSIAQDIQLFGFLIICIASFTMVAGMILAVIQNDIKRTLAYSSISQMGFILFGVGCFVYLGEHGAVALGGSLYHILNHAFLKSCLFLVAGSIIYCTHQHNMLRLGGLWRKMPISTILWCIAALGIMGVPLLNGFASKTLLHHAIVEAGHLAHESNAIFAPWLKIAEIIFIIASAGTVLYFLKMTYYIFFKSRGTTDFQQNEIKEAPKWMIGGSTMLIVGAIVIGLSPAIFLRQLIIPMLEMFKGLNIHDIEHLKEISILTLPNITEVILPMLLGVGSFIIGLRLKFFENGIKILGFKIPKTPVWFSFDYCYIFFAKEFIIACYLMQKFFQKIEYEVSGLVKSGFFGIREATIHVSGLRNRKYIEIKSYLITILRAITSKLDNSFNIQLDNMTLGVLAIAICLTFLVIYLWI